MYGLTDWEKIIKKLFYLDINTSLSNPNSIPYYRNNINAIGIIFPANRNITQERGKASNFRQMLALYL